MYTGLATLVPIMITKRALGIGFIIVSTLAIVGTFMADLIGLSADSGLGPVQRNLLIAAFIVLVIGLTLIPLGDSPA